MKDFIDNNKSYNLEDVKRVLHKVEDEKVDYKTLSTTGQIETLSLKRSGLLVSVLVASLTSASLAATDLPFDDQNNVFQQNITKADINHNDYIKFIASQAVMNSTNKNELIEEILSFKSLQENWDGYGAIPSENKASANAIDLIYKLKPSVLNKITSIFPTTNGTVSFIWENKDEERVSFEIGTENYSFYTKLNNLKPTFYDGLISDNNWSSILEKEVHKL